MSVETRWLLGSGATCHMCKDREKFVTFNEDYSTSIYTATDSSTQSEGVGDVQIRTKDGKTVLLKNTLYVPDLRTNLISVLQFAKRGYIVDFGDERAEVRKKRGPVLFSAVHEGGVYVVWEVSEDSSKQPPQEAGRKPRQGKK